MAVSFTGIETKRGDVLRLRPSDIIADDTLRGRQFGSEEQDVAAMVDSFRTNGQLQPVVIRKRPDGKPQIVAGYTRRLAGLAIEASDPEFRLQCILVAGNENDALKLAIEENNRRTDLTDIQHAHNQELLRRRGVFATDQEIATFYGWHPSRVSRLRKLLLLPDTLQREMHTGALSTRAAVLMTELDPSQQSALHAAGVTRASDVEEAVRRAQTRQTADEENGGTTLDFERLESQDSNTLKKPQGRIRQRNMQQLKGVLRFASEKGGCAAIRALADVLLTYQSGECDDTEVFRVMKHIAEKHAR